MFLIQDILKSSKDGSVGNALRFSTFVGLVGVFFHLLGFCTEFYAEMNQILKGVISCWVPVQQQLDSNEKRNHCKIPLPGGKKQRTGINIFRDFQHMNTFPINLNSRKRKKSVPSLRVIS